MALSYDPTTKKWNVTQEKTDYQTDFPTNFYSPDTMTVWAKYKTVRQQINDRTWVDRIVLDGLEISPTEPPRSAQQPSPWQSKGNLPVNYTLDQLKKLAGTAGLVNSNGDPSDELAHLAYAKSSEYQQNANKNALNTRKNQENAALNTENTNRNNAYQTVLGVANSTAGGDYVTQRDQIRKLQGVSDAERARLED